MQDPRRRQAECSITGSPRTLELDDKFLTRNSNPSNTLPSDPAAYTPLYPLLPTFQLPSSPVAAHHTIHLALPAFLSDRAAHSSSVLVCLVSVAVSKVKPSTTTPVSALLFQTFSQIHFLLHPCHDAGRHAAS